MRQHDLETVIKCVFSVFNTPNATSATMVDSSKKPVTMTVTVSQSQSSQQRQPKIKNRHFPRIFGTIKAQSDKQRMVGPKQNVTGSNPVRSTKTVRNKGVSVGLKNPVSGFGAKRYNMATQKNLVTFCDVHMVSSVWVFKWKWYGRSPIAEIEQDTHVTWRD